MTKKRNSEDSIQNGIPLPEEYPLAPVERRALQKYAKGIKEDENSRIRTAKLEYTQVGVHNRLKQVREEAHRTQSEMASMFKITQPYYSTYEDGERMLTAPMLMLLIKEGFSVDYILSGKGSIRFLEQRVNNTDYELLRKDNEHLKSENEFLKKQITDLIEVLKKNK